MNWLPDAFFPLVGALFTVGVLFVFHTMIRPSERMRAVPVIWRVLPVAIIAAGLFAGFLARFYPRGWDAMIAAGALLLSVLAAWWGSLVDRRLNGPDRTRGATTLFADKTPR